MSTQYTVAINKNQWTLVAENIMEGKIYFDTWQPQNYKLVHRFHKDSAPTNFEIALPPVKNPHRIKTMEPIDLYLSCDQVDGKVVLDLDYELDRPMLVKQGKVFTWHQVISIPAGSQKLVLSDLSALLPNLPDFIGLSTSYELLMKTTAGPVFVNLYAGTDYTGGTPVTIINRNTNSTITPKSIFLEDPTGTNKGTLALQYLVGTASTNQNSGGGSNNAVNPFLQGPGISLLEIDNQSGDPISFEIETTFSEV